MFPDEAAMATFTGKMADRYGFTNVAIEQLTGSPGYYTKAVVLFTK